MANNKHALIRYKAIDALLSGTEPVTIEQMQEACQKGLSGEIVSRVTIYADLKALEEDWKVIIKKSNTRPVKYIYGKGSPTFNGTKVSDDTYDDVKYVLKYLDSISGILKADKAVAKLHKSLEGLGDERKDLIGFGSNHGLKNSDLLWEIYRYIRMDKPLSITYNKAYESSAPYDVQPYYLKQYRNRWFLIGWKYVDKGSINGELRTFALDRIDVLKINRSRVLMKDLIRPNDFNSNQYFKDIIGVTRWEKEELQHIVLKADLSVHAGKYDYNRIITKPLHPSQRFEEKDGFGYIYLDVIPNNELYSELLSFESIEVASPESVRKQFTDRLQALVNHYPELQKKKKSTKKKESCQ